MRALVVATEHCGKEETVKCIAILAAVLLSFGTHAAASCAQDGQRTQSVAVSVEGRQLERWEVVMGDIHHVRLPRGFDLGIRIDPTTPEKYRETFAKTQWRGVDELVKITLLDMSSTPPGELSVTWGGANSKQGFGPRGGANGVPTLIDQIELWLHNPVCVTPEKAANR